VAGTVVIDSSYYAAAVALIQAMGGPVTPGMVQALAAWSFCEMPHTSAGAWVYNNPWATTLTGSAYPSLGPINDKGVQHYTSPAVGIAATVATLRNGLYPHIVQAIASGDPGPLLGGSAVPDWETWAGSSYDARCVPEFYNELAPPPSIYFTAPAPAPGGAGVTTPTAIVALGPLQVPVWVVSLGISLAAVGAVAGLVLVVPDWRQAAEAEERRLAANVARWRRGALS